MNIDNTQSQMRKGILEFCILSVIRRGEAYPGDIVDEMRQAGLAANGEFGAENLAYKMLRNKGLLDKLWYSATQAQDEKLSI